MDENKAIFLSSLAYTCLMYVVMCLRYRLLKNTCASDPHLQNQDTKLLYSINILENNLEKIEDQFLDIVTLLKKMKITQTKFELHVGGSSLFEIVSLCRLVFRYLYFRDVYINKVYEFFKVKNLYLLICGFGNGILGIF